MDKQEALNKHFLLIIIAAMGWFALTAQLYLIIIYRTAALAETLLRYFSFFTILSNILVAVCATALIINSRHHFFSKSSTITAITIYITVVGLVYNIILRPLWKPQGLQKGVDELLHTIIPALFIIFWILWASISTLEWKNILSWLIYPFFYSIFILARGAFSGYYPYPFMDVNVLGYNKVLVNSAGLVIIFLLFSFFTVLFGKMRKH